MVGQYFRSLMGGVIQGSPDGTAAAPSDAAGMAPPWFALFFFPQRRGLRARA